MSFTLTQTTGEAEETLWLVENRVRQNVVNLIDGRGESGKSSLVSKIIGEWNANRSLPADRKLRGVLWISEEEDFDSDIKPRLLHYGLNNSQLFTIDYRNGACSRPILPHQEPMFIDLIKANHINCIVIDPFTEAKPADWTIFDSDAMRTYMSALGRVCTTTRSTIFAMRHMRKASGGHSSDDGLGCAMIKDTARAVTRVDKTEETIPRFFWAVQKCNKAKPTRAMQFTFTDTGKDFGNLEWVGESSFTISDVKKLSETKVNRMKLQEAKRLLLEALKDQDVSSKELIEEAKNFGIGDRTLDAAKAELNIRSDRRKDLSTGKAYWVWMKINPEHLPPNIDTGEPDMQATLMDLPEATGRPLNPTAEAFTQAELDAYPHGIPDDSEVSQQVIKGGKLTKAVAKAEKKPKANKQPTGAGQGTTPKKTPKAKSK